jgi:lysosomal alpha-mannosidase
MVTVHIIPHSHTDAGWRKTPDEYFTGAMVRVDNAAVQFTYDTVAEELSKDSDRKFTAVDMKLFKKWYTNLNNDKQ